MILATSGFRRDLNRIQKNDHEMSNRDIPNKNSFCKTDAPKLKETGTLRGREVRISTRELVEGDLGMGQNP